MSYGPPINIPKVSSQGEYRSNKERLEMAKRMIEVYDSMNEDAWRQHREEELARKVSEGDRAREELERLRALRPLAIAAPPMISEPQVPYSPPSLHAPATARIEEVPSNTLYGDQRNPYSSTSNSHVQMNRPVQNPYPSTSSSRVQVNQPRKNSYPSMSGFQVQMNQPVQNAYPSTLSSQVQIQPTQNHQSYPPTPHTFFNNSGTIQEQPNQAATSFRHRPKAIPSQATRTPLSVQQPMNPAIVRGQVSNSAPPQQIVIPETRNDVHRHAPPARKQSGPQQPPESTRSNTQQKAAVIQQQTVSQQGHSQHTIAPITSVRVKSSEQGHSKSPVNSSSSLIVVRQGASTRTNVAMQDNAHASTSASTVGQPKETTVPTTQPSSSTSSGDVTARLHQQISSNQPFIEYLRAGYPQWVNSVRPDTYAIIPNTPLMIAKRSDHVMFLVVPDGQSGHAFLDMVPLITKTPFAGGPASQGNAQQPAGLPKLPGSTTSQPQLQLRATSGPSSTAGGSSQSSFQAPIIPQSQLPITSKPLSTASEIGSTYTFVQSQAVPQSPLRTPQQKTPIASPAKPNLRTPADADKRHLARDILRALGFKRPRPMDASETQSLEPASKRHQPGPGIRVGFAGKERETNPTQPTPRAVPVDEMQGVQSGQPVVPVQPPVSGEQSTQEHVEPVGTSAIDSGPTQPISDTVPAVSIPDSAQPGQPVASAVPPDESKSAPTPTGPHTGSLPIDASVVLATEPTAAPSTLIDIPSPIINSPKLGPVIENVAPEAAIECSPEEELTIMDIDGPLSSTDAIPYIVESPGTKAADFQKSDDAASEFDRLTIQDEIMSPATDHPESSLQIEELEEDEVEMLDVLDASREGLMLQGVWEPSEEGEVSALRASQEEGEITMVRGLQETSQEEGEITMVQDLRETSQEEGETAMVRETSQKEGETTTVRETSPEGEVLMSPEIKRGLGDAEGMPPVHSVTPMPQAKEGNETASRTPLFLPSPSPSPQRGGSSTSSIMIPPPSSNHVDEDMHDVDDIPEATKTERKLKSIYRRVRTGDQPFYVLVPSSPPYLVKFRKEEARRQRKKRKLAFLQSDAVDYRRTRYSRSASQEDVVDPVTKKTLEDSTTRLAERRCKWSGCDTVMNSPQHLFKHLRRHCVPDYTKKYVLCYWTGCGDHIPNSQIDEHLATHAFTPLSCPYEDCEESFRAVQSLVKHNDLNHKNGQLKRSPEPFAPSIEEPPPVPSQIPAYMINSGLVRQEPIDRRRHLSLLGPWVYNNIAGPVRVTKKYNAAKGKPDDHELLQDSSMRFSSNPSKPAKIRDMGNLQSVEVSELVSDGLIIWPPKKKKASHKMDAEMELKPLMLNTSSEEDELQDDDLFGNNDLVMDDPEVGQARNLEVKHVSHPTHTSSDEDAVVTMLTES